jgi:hypothetical protein
MELDYSIDISTQINLSDLVFKIAQNVDLKTVEEFIIELNRQCEEWELTVNLCRHFAKLYQSYLNEVVEKVCPECGSDVHITDNEVDGHYVGCNKCTWYDEI